MIDFPRGMLRISCGVCLVFPLGMLRISWDMIGVPTSQGYVKNIMEHVQCSQGYVKNIMGYDWCSQWYVKNVMEYVQCSWGMLRILWGMFGTSYVECSPVV